MSETRTVVRRQTAQVEALTEPVIRFMPSTVTVIPNQKCLKTTVQVQAFMPSNLTVCVSQFSHVKWMQFTLVKRCFCCFSALELTFSENEKTEFLLRDENIHFYLDVSLEVTQIASSTTEREAPEVSRALGNESSKITNKCTFLNFFSSSAWYSLTCFG